ncbi:MAG: DegT/DnrJ/EryC1/StrS family aminotransferase [Gammaproteobacteria bacterium]|nr:DegT/DnrJ/EryC1/StrS family aminotransferase [Gammaproteobacteria bacterium]
MDSPLSPLAEPSRGVATSRPHLTAAELEAVARVMASGYLGMGPETRAFEQELATYFGGSRQVVCVNTGTSALHLAVAALDLRPGDEVLVPTFTFVATFQAIVTGGGWPRLCDVDPATGLIDLANARQRLRPAVKAVMPVHYAGNPGSLDDIYAFAEEHGLRVIEDAAHAFGSRDHGRRVGSFGDIVCFSFDPIKNITSGEGGAVVTANAQIAARSRAMRSLGLEPDAKRFADGSPDVLRKGWRFHMPDLAAAVGRVQLARFESELKPVRVALARQYRRQLAGAQLVSPLDFGDDTVPHIMPVRVRARRRDELRRRLGAAGYETRVHYRPGHHLSAFADSAEFPGAELLFAEVLSLPLHLGVAAEDVTAIAAFCNEL